MWVDTVDGEKLLIKAGNRELLLGPEEAEKLAAIILSRHARSAPQDRESKRLYNDRLGEGWPYKPIKIEEG